MLRKGLITLGLLVVLLGLAALASGIVGKAAIFVIWGAILVAAIVFERFRYKPLTRDRPGPGWERTTERFVDEETGNTVTVYVNPETGERSYVKE